MRLAYAAFLLVTLAVAGLATAAAFGQQVTIGASNQTISDSFFERTGTNWGFNWRGASFNFGNGGMANPQFGGFDPSAGINSGFALNGRNFNGFFNWSMAQGSRTSFTSQTPMVTMMNGQQGYFSDTSQSPFVIGNIPVVGGFPTVGGMGPMMPAAADPVGSSMVAPPATNYRVQAMQRALAEGSRSIAESPRHAPPKRDAAAAKEKDSAPAPVVAAVGGRIGSAVSSSADRPAPSVAEAQRLHEIEQAKGDGEVQALIERARAAEEDGKPNVAKIYYRMALQRASGDLKNQVQVRLENLSNQ